MSDVTKPEEPKLLSEPTEPKEDQNPTIEVLVTPEGIEEGKKKGNEKFLNGSYEEAITWFSKSLWTVQEKEVVIPPTTQSFLFSNRSFCWLKLQKWKQAEVDATHALTVNPGNIKALYRRAWARCEQSLLEQAKEDLDSFAKLNQLSAQDADVANLLSRVTDSLKDPSFTFISILDEGDDTEKFGEVEPTYRDGVCLWSAVFAIPKSKAKENLTPQDCEFEPVMDPQPPAVRPLDLKNKKHLEASKPYPHPKGIGKTMPSILPAGFVTKKEEEDSGDDLEDDATIKNVKKIEELKSPKTDDPYPTLEAAMTETGIQKAKEAGNNLFGGDNYEKAIEWFTKAIWIGTEINSTSDVVTVLYSNRSAAYCKLKNWDNAIDDATEALKLKGDNFKALFRRAEARFELGQLEDAEKDITASLKIKSTPAQEQLKSAVDKKIMEGKDTEVIPAA